MKYLVEALDTYEKLDISDKELGRVPLTGELFEVSKDRLEVLLGKNDHNVAFVKLVENEIPVKEKEEATEEVKEEKEVKPTKPFKKKVTR